mmetsp:Transcript_969/g.2975  ORF Transcript_969/g.2975 Transcript_969/m.2975 type:complete len:243 (-) Transcript_969:1346-2074(-)
MLAPSLGLDCFLELSFALAFARATCGGTAGSLDASGGWKALLNVRRDLKGRSSCGFVGTLLLRLLPETGCPAAGAAAAAAGSCSDTGSPPAPVAGATDGPAVLEVFLQSRTACTAITMGFRSSNSCRCSRNSRWYHRRRHESRSRPGMSLLTCVQGMLPSPLVCFSTQASSSLSSAAVHFLFTRSGFRQSCQRSRTWWPFLPWTQFATAVHLKPCFATAARRRWSSSAVHLLRFFLPSSIVP